MNTQANAIHESPPGAQANSAEIFSPSRLLYWSVQRELWENRSIYLAPLAAAAVFLCGFLISLIGLPHKWRVLSVLDPAQQHEAIASPYNMATLLIMATVFIVGIFYCLDALHGERRDRSILFWKSLPVSDLTTVLSKASIPIVVLPLLAFAITVATHWIMLLLSSAVLLVSGLGVATLWTQVSLFQMWLMLFYHLLAIHALWYAPIYAWLLLVSAWARRAVFLWAALPLLAIAVVEKIAFNTSHFAGLLRYRFRGGPEGVPFTEGNMSMHPLMHLTPGNFLTSPGLWIGLAVAAACLATATRLRQYRGPI